MKKWFVFLAIVLFAVWLWAATTSKQFTINVKPSDPVITNVSFPDAQVGVPYSVQLTGTGGIPPYTYTVKAGSGSLPNGLTLSSSGLISGTPTNYGIFTFSIDMTDSQGTTSSVKVNTSLTNSTVTQ